ncbi:MAG: DinB family protein [Acidobacteriaceae bacterium]|nr:DinB family protein [Acidobacteriaceae bacterium]
MLETQRIADQLRRLYDGPSWLGPSVREIVSDITAERAAFPPANGCHTIWELVLHITATLRLARERLSARTIRDHTMEESWPVVSDAWPEVLAELEAETLAIEEAIRSFPAERLDERAPATEPQTFYILLHGAIQHTAYHAGQIALLKKESTGRPI